MAEVTDETFESAVLDRSVEVPVLVDLWAEWCGPCRTLTPILEKVVAESDGRLELAKVNVDENPQVSAAFRVQSIPAVFAIRDRQVVDSFIGALPEPAVREFVARVAPAPSEADELVALGDEASLRRALELEPAHEGAIVKLAEYLVERGNQGDTEQALALLAKVPETGDVRRVAALARTGVAPDAATSGAGSNGVEVRLNTLLDRVKDDDAARQEFLDLLEVLGPDHPRTAEYRRQLTARLF